MDEVCGSIRNYFVIKPDGIRRGKFTISNGNLESADLQEGQYFRVVGSVFNDGVWQYPATEMQAETFSGEVWAMGVPPAFIALLSDIEAWNQKYGTADSANLSPFQSESFGGYSYTKDSGSSSGSESSPSTWAGAFESRLSRWRKLP